MSKRCFKNSFWFVAAVFLTAAAHDLQRSDNASHEPVVITSNRMEADELGTKVVFSGNVVLKKENMSLSSDAMTVLYDVASKEVREIDARGNVVVRKEGRVAFSDFASYFSSDERIVLTGNARILENENQLGGDKITLFMRGDRSLVEGGKVLLYQDKQDKPLEGRKRKQSQRNE